MERRRIFLAAAIWLIIVVLVGLTRPEPAPQFQTISADTYFDKVYGSWKATMLANHAGLDLQGVYLEEPGPPGSFSLPQFEEWSTDDDTHVEWVDLHILETHGLEPTAEEIRVEWVDHLNHDIWVSTRRARDLMDEGLLPPETGNAENNPDGAWSIDAQLQTELFGMLAPGMPAVASTYAKRFARVTNSGPAVEASVFFAALYSLAFFEEDVPALIAAARQLTEDEAIIAPIVDNVVLWHQQNPGDWRLTRQQIRDEYDTDPMWWASRVNFAVTIMALLYGESDILRTIEIAALAGWDADNTMATAAGLLGLIHGHSELPEEIAASTDIYFNEDVTGDLPRYDTVTQFAVRTQNLAEAMITRAGGTTYQGIYRIPPQTPPLPGR
ncbi:MAG: ADP-ribosylglycohydrolase family protein [Caldilineaceae bacterium]|nr:ADP-ribosylglycohydrolase family protein [Caldilineaceae bacterium]